MTTLALVALAAVIALAMFAETWLLVHLRRQAGGIEHRSAELQRKVNFRNWIADQRRAGNTPGQAGLPAGSILNDFELRSLDGTWVTSSQWRGERIAVLFVQHDCPFSRRLIEAIDRWRSLPSRLLIVTTGSEEVNRELFAGAPDRVAVLLQDEMELARVWRVTRSPAMYLIDELGVTDGPLRLGAADILEALDCPALDESDDGHDPSGSSHYSVPTPVSSRPPVTGQQVPDLPVALLDGESRTLSAERQTLLLVLDLRCVACRDGLGRLAEPVRSLANQARVLALSWGDEPAAREVATALGPNVAVSAQPSSRLLKRLGMMHAPSAVLLDETGAALSDTAIGAGAILALLESMTPASAGVDR